jgi:hypothetical protein
MRLMQQTPAQGTRTRRVAEPHDVIDVLSDLFILQGIPAYIRSDNGPEFLSAENLRAMSDLIPLAVMVMLPLALCWRRRVPYIAPALLTSTSSFE